MSLNESTVEAAALEGGCLRAGTQRQFTDFGDAVGHGPHLATGKLAAEPAGAPSRAGQHAVSTAAHKNPFIASLYIERSLA